MNLNAFLHECDPLEAPSRVELFEIEIARKAKDLNEKFGVSTQLSYQVLKATAEISPSLPPDNQEERILKSGFNNTDLIYYPSFEYALDNLGVELATTIFKNKLLELIKSWSFTQSAVPAYSLSTHLPILLLESEWLSSLGEYLAYLNSEKQSLIEFGKPRTVPNISFLLRVFPISMLNDDKIWECRIKELEQASPEEIEKLYFEPQNKTSTSQLFEEFIMAIDDELPDRSFLVPYREKIHRLYIAGISVIFNKLSSKTIDQVAYEISRVILKELNPAQIKELRELEDIYGLEVFEFGADTQSNLVAFDSKLPIVIYNLIAALSLPVFETKTKLVASLRTRFVDNTEFTKLGFPRFSLDFWKELKKDKQNFLDSISEAENVFSQIQSFIGEFSEKVVQNLQDAKSDRFTSGRPYSVDLNKYEPELSKEDSLEDENVESISEIFSAISEASADKQIFAIDGSEYKFKNSFRELHWRDQVWRFREWERKIVEAFYEAYIKDSFITSDQINEMAQRLHFSVIDSVPKRRYPGRDVFKGNELWMKFFVPHLSGKEKKTGRYTLNPKWTPVSE